MNIAVPAARRILVVEDEAMIAMMLESTLQRLGITVLGPIGRLSDALDIARSDAFDGAILDVTIRGGNVYAVAEILVRRGIPFVLATGHAAHHLPASLQAQRLLRKPYSTADVMAALQYIGNTKSAEPA